jgi:EAL domain-containing protein (putative c-di-GMP-specific phosphodiesterase class I)
VRASVGIAISQPAAAPGDLLRNADVAMYAAKTRGDGGWALFDPSMHAQAIARLELSAELPAAIERGEMELFYQPIVGLQGQPVGGAEALVRWRHPRRGLLGPGEFICLAESTGAIVPLGRWVLEQACRDVAAWQRLAGARRLYVSVNVSAAQLAEEAFVGHVREALAAAGAEPRALMLEITETLIAHDTGGAVRRLAELRELGVRTAIDDFGTGHSALSSLRRLPVDVLKIDRSFIEELTSHPESRKVLAGVVQLGRSLDLEIIAEGVEHADQARELATLGAMSAQGYLYARPMPAGELDMAAHLGVAMPRGIDAS